MQGNTGQKRPDVAEKNKARTWTVEARAAIAASNKRRIKKPTITK